MTLKAIKEELDYEWQKPGIEKQLLSLKAAIDGILAYLEPPKSQKHRAGCRPNSS